VGSSAAGLLGFAAGRFRAGAAVDRFRAVVLLAVVLRAVVLLAVVLLVLALVLVLLVLRRRRPGMGLPLVPWHGKRHIRQDVVESPGERGPG
jgi:hypothetical protein